MVMTTSNDTICAPATAPGRAGLAVVRLSGREAALVADRIFYFGPIPSDSEVTRKPRRSILSMKGYTAAYGHLRHPETCRVLDEAIVTRFVAPHSYTGEDVVEIAIHGSMLRVRDVVEALYAAGARPAGPGEFTQRAFLNGRMDLSQAEAVIALIDSEATATADAALKQLSGHLSQKVEELKHRGIQLLSEIELAIQYPEHEDSNISTTQIVTRLQTIRDDMHVLRQSRHQGRILQEGLKLVLLGRPNAGKSSLLNRLSGEDRAIVTAVPGTTRDLLEVRVEIQGLPVIVHDTAGLRESDDLLEQLSMDRTRNALLNADLVLVMVDPDDLPSYEESAEWAHLIGGKAYIQLRTKSDLSKDPSLSLERTNAWQMWSETFTTLCSEAPRPARPFAITSASVETPDGMRGIEETLKAFYESLGTVSGENLMITTERQALALKDAIDALNLVIDAPAAIPEDMMATALQAALEHLATLTGEIVTDEMLSDLFSRFCVGK